MRSTEETTTQETLTQAGWQRAVFYGGSDDLVEVEGVRGADEFCNDANHDRLVAMRFTLRCPDRPDLGAMRVTALYDGCWHFAAGQVDEGAPLPSWPVRVDQSPDVPYSARLTVECPPSAEVFRDRR